MQAGWTGASCEVYVWQFEIFSRWWRARRPGTFACREWWGWDGLGWVGLDGGRRLIWKHGLRCFFADG